jgi:signal transduction histidine kinase
VDHALDDHQRAELLADVAGAVAWCPDPPTAVRRVAELAVPRLADWCAVDVLEGETAYRRLAVAHADPRCRAHAEQLLGRWQPDAQPRGVAWVMRTGEAAMAADGVDPRALVPATHPDAERLARELGMGAYLSVPLRAESRPLGALTLVAASPSRRFDDADVSLAKTLARMIALPLAQARLDRELAAVNRRQDDVLAILSHELRTPLTAMMAWLQLLHHGANETETARALSIIERNGRLLSRLIDDLMDTSSIVLGRLRVERQPVDLAAVVHHAAIELADGARDKGVRMDVEVDASAGRYVGDRVRLEQLVVALLSNAVKFTPPGGRVVIRLDGDATHARLTVSDTGCGIARELLPYVFDVFRRDERAPGLGIGLARVRGLVALHGGTVQASSEGIDLGATFTVTLPRR